MRWMGMTLAVACAMVASHGAWAQRSGRSTAAPRSGSSEQEQLPPSVPPPVPTLAPTRGISGPRIEPGAVLCKTDGDLRHRAEVNRRRIDGVPDAGDPLYGCRLINEARGVEVISREGLGLVQIRLKPSGEVGWTDTYLR